MDKDKLYSILILQAPDFKNMILKSSFLQSTSYFAIKTSFSIQIDLIGVLIIL